MYSVCKPNRGMHMNDYVTIDEASKLAGRSKDTIRRLWQTADRKVDPRLKKKWTITSKGMLLINKDLLISEYGLNTASTSDDNVKDDTEHIEPNNSDQTGDIKTLNRYIASLEKQLDIVNERNKELQQTNAYQAQSIVNLQISATASQPTEGEVIQPYQSEGEATAEPVEVKQSSQKKKRAKPTAKRSKKVSAKSTPVKNKPVKKKRFSLFRRK